MLIAVKQINQIDLTNFVNSVSSGAAFSGNLNNYVNASGWLGNQVLYGSGGTQQVLTTLNFTVSPNVPYVGNTGSATNYLLVVNMINSGLNILNTGITSSYITITGNEQIGGYKSFTGQFQVQGNPVGIFDVINNRYLLGVSGILQSGINSIVVPNTVDTFSTQTISGLKIFTILPQSNVTPVNSADFVTKAYVDSSNPMGVVTTTGDQIISGNKTFLQSPIVPIATNGNQAVTYTQLASVGTVMGNITGFAGVLQINSTSGASGTIYLEGAGTVQVIQCGPIFYISGITPNNATQLYSARIPLPSGITGLQFIYASGFSSNPVVVGEMEMTGTGPISFFQQLVYNVSTTGFNVAFQSGIPSNNYYFDFTATPVVSGGSGFATLQGPQGLLGQSINVRGIWGQGTVYNQYDVVYNPPYNASFISNQTAISTLGNQPAGSGNGPWTIFATGVIGATGASGAIGSLVISSGAYITGNFVNLSFFLNPVSTGLNLSESWVVQTFRCTGFALGCTSSGLGPAFGSNGILSGDLYYRDQSNNKTIFQNFTFNSGAWTYISGGFSTTITGYSRIGIDLTNTLSGIQNFSIGVFGF